MKKISRDNTHKKDIVSNIFNAVGVPSSYAAKLIDDLISILIFNLIKKEQLKIIIVILIKEWFVLLI